MRSYLLFALIAFVGVLAPTAASQTVFRGEVTVAWGKVRLPDGTMRDISGLKLPATIERIEATRVGRKNLKSDAGRLETTAFGRVVARLNGPLPSSGTRRNIFSSSTAYLNDAGSGYAILDPLEFSDPSSLDDVSMVGGANIPWENLQFGFHVESPHNVYVCWSGFSTYNPGAAPTENAFSNVFCDDVAISLPASLYGNTPGTYKLTISVAPQPLIGFPGILSPGNSIYFSQQFRPGPPLGVFDDSFFNVYNAGGAPSVGSSANQWWYDWDPMDGIYTNGEIDVLSGEGNFSNHLRTITVNGTVDTLTPTSFTVVRGRDVTGTLSNLFTSNDFYLSCRASPFAQPNNPPIQLRVEGEPLSNNATSITIHVESATTSGSALQRISLFNFQTNAYEVIYGPTAATSTDSTVVVTPTGNPTRFIRPADASNPPMVRALLAYTPGAISTTAWRIRWDRVAWVVTR